MLGVDVQAACLSCVTFSRSYPCLSEINFPVASKWIVVSSLQIKLTRTTQLTVILEQMAGQKWHPTDKGLPNKRTYTDHKGNPLPATVGGP